MQQGNYERFYYNAKIGDAQTRLQFWESKHSAALAEIHCQSSMARCAMDQIKLIQAEIAEYQQMMMNVGKGVVEDAKAGTHDQESAKDQAHANTGDGKTNQAGV